MADQGADASTYGQLAMFGALGGAGGVGIAGMVGPTQLPQASPPHPPLPTPPQHCFLQLLSFSVFFFFSRSNVSVTLNV